MKGIKMPRSKKVTTRKGKKTTVKAAVKKEISDIDQEVIYYKELVYKVRKSKKKEEVNDAFEKIVDWLDPKIKKIAGKFRIPGLNFDDIYQECLCALQQKAIQDYDETRGSDPTKPAPFDRFALLCIRRHLSTKLKASNGNKIRAINESKSLDQDRSNDQSELSLIEIISSKDKDVSVYIQDKEHFVVLMQKLVKKLSPFEMQVLRLYAQQFTYEEIADAIKRKSAKKVRINVKGVDNALSRIKNKAKVIIDKITHKEKLEQEHRELRRVDNALSRIKHKARKIDIK